MVAGAPGAVRGASATLLLAGLTATSTLAGTLGGVDTAMVSACGLEGPGAAEGVCLANAFSFFFLASFCTREQYRAFNQFICIYT